MKLLSILIPCTLSWDQTVRVFGGDANMQAIYDIDQTGINIVTAMPDRGRIYHEVVNYKGDVYLIGGQPGGKNGSAKSKALNQVFTFRNETWVSAPSMNRARARHAVSIHDGEIWACGGRGGGGFSSLLTCESFDGQQWTPRRQMIGTPYWTSPQGRDRFALVSTGQGLMALGGHNSYAREGQSSTEIFSSQVGRWLPGPKMPTARFGHKALNYHDEIFVFGGEIDADKASILKLTDFQSEWQSIGQMINPVRMKFIALNYGNEAFLYGGKCEKASRSDMPSWAACSPMAEIFNLDNYQSTAFNVTELPGNLEASAVLLTPEVTTVAPIIELEQLESIDGLTARTFKVDGLDDELAAMFAEFENEEENEFLFDFVPSDAQFELMNEEEDAQLSFDDQLIDAQVNQTATSPDADDATLEIDATISENGDSDKDGNTEADLDYFDLAPSFSLKGNLSEIVDTLVRRYGQPVNETEKEKLSLAISDETVVSEFDAGLNAFQRSIASDLSSRRVTINGEEVIFARNSFQCWSCDAVDPTDCLNNGAPVVCPTEQQSCVIYSEKQNGRDVAFRTGCSIESVCQDQKKQNYVGTTLRALWRFNQCKPTATRGSSSCNQCCSTTLCNDMNTFNENTFDWET